MKAIHTKLLRDLIRLKAQASAIGLVMACGIATFVMALSLIDSLTGTIDAYYERNRFADVFAHAKRAPLNLTERISEIPGVAHADTRIVETVRLDIEHLPEPASGTIVSLPENPGSGLNLLYLRAGRYPEPAGSREVLVSQRFAQAHRLRPGDKVRAVLNGRSEDLRIVGIALSPEYVYLISPGAIFPERERYAVFWMRRDEMEAAFDMDGAFNDIALALAPGANEHKVIERLDALTEPYGGLGAHTRDDQLSNTFVQNELRGLRGMTLVVPIVFLAVSAFLLNIVLSRMIATQREQIAALKALGYSRAEIGRHYLGFVLMITLLAAAAGSLSGALMGRGMTALYIEFFDFPSFRYVLLPRVIALATLVSMCCALLGVAQALRGAMNLPPAEAMRPQPPPTFKPTIIERIGLHKALPTRTRMILRQLERRPMRTGLSVLGVALATAILVVGTFSADAIDDVLDLEYHRVQRYDLDVVFFDETDHASLASIRHMPGVRSAEPYRTLAVRIRHNNAQRRIAITGLTRADGLYHLMDRSAEPVGLPEHGIVLSSTLARALGLSVGDETAIEVLQGRRPTLRVHVSAIIDTFSGLAAYMNLDEMNRLMREPHTISGVYLRNDPRHAQALYQALHAAPRVAAVNNKSQTLENFRDTISSNIAIVRPFIIGFAVAIAFGVVYNSARISLSERAKDLATLRVLGYTRKEIASIQLGELALITALAIPLGLAVGHALAWLTTNATDSELVRIPFVIHPSTYAFACIVILLASTASGLAIRSMLDRLDLISVLKARE